MPFVAIIYRLSAKIFQLSHKDSISQAIYMARAVLLGRNPLRAGSGGSCSVSINNLYTRRDVGALWERERGRGAGCCSAVQMSNTLGPQAVIYLS